VTKLALLKTPALFLSKIMQKTSRFFIVILLFSITFTACKYEDGPGITLRANRDRIANEWIVDKFIYDGKDITNSVNSRQDIFSIIFEMTRIGSYSVEWVRFTIDPNNAIKYYGTSNAINHNLNYLGPAMWNPRNIENYGRKLPIPLMVLGFRGYWSFDGKHQKISIGHESSYSTVPGDGNTRFWTITKLNEKNIPLKGFDSGGKAWTV